LHGDISLDDRLTAKAGTKRETGGHIETVQFIVFGFGEIRLAVLHQNVACGASAAAAASVFQMDAEIHCDVE